MSITPRIAGDTLAWIAAILISVIVFQLFTGSGEHGELIPLVVIAIICVAAANLIAAKYGRRSARK